MANTKNKLEDGESVFPHPRSSLGVFVPIAIFVTWAAIAVATLGSIGAALRPDRPAALTRVA